MPCDHLGPIDLMQMAEEHLRSHGIAEPEWRGKTFAYGENLTEGMWASVWTEIERRGDEWIVTRIDRNRDPLPDSRLGLCEISGAA